MNRFPALAGPVALLALVGSGGCGGGGNARDARDAGSDAAVHDGAGDNEVGDGPMTADVEDGATSETSDAPPPDDGGPDQGPSAPRSLVVVAAQNVLALDACSVTPAVLMDIPAGAYRMELSTSSLSKGSVSGPEVPSFDDYVIVNLPLGAGDPQQDHRYFMLNGVGAGADVTLAATGTIQIMFIDSDSGSNAGDATITLNPGGYSTTVNAVTNVLRWQEGCVSTPASLVVTHRPHRATLTDSTLSSGSASRDDFVVLRLPDETPRNDHRFVILNGVGASQDFTPLNSETVRAWFISATGGGSGQATVTVSDL